MADAEVMTVRDVAWAKDGVLPSHPLYRVVKRLFDVVASLLIVTFFAPVIAVISVAVAVRMGWPIHFRQSRAGYQGRPLQILKLRSMTSERDENGLLLPDTRRTPSLGRFIRRFRLDELPCVINILRGDMSMVGPRPLLPHTITDEQICFLRTSVRPGFTGLAQVSGNTLLSNDEKVALDLYYISQASFTLDIEILTKTFPTILRGEQRDEALIQRAVEAMQRHANIND